MEEMVRKLDAEYGFNLSEEEIKLIARQAGEAERLFQRLYGVDFTGLNPETVATAAIGNSFVDNLVKEKFIEKAFAEKPCYLLS